MGLFVSNSGVIITHVFDKAALILTVIRWAWCMVFSHMGLHFNQYYSIHESSSSSSSSFPSPQMIKDSLQVATYSDMCRRQAGIESGTCAVCLDQLKGKDKVWELRNCGHVFHKRCLDQCLDQHHHHTCPLCRAPLLSHPLAWPTPTEPSWAVEQLIYLFRDDLLFT